MPTYKRYILKDGPTVYFFTKRPYQIYDRAWVDAYKHPHPVCCLQEYEADFDFSELPPNQIVEVTMKVTLAK